MSLGMVFIGIGAIFFGIAIKLLDSQPQKAILSQLIAGAVLLLAGLMDLSNGQFRGIIPLLFGIALLVLPFIWKIEAYAKPESRELLSELRQNAATALMDLVFLTGFLIFMAAYCMVIFGAIWSLTTPLYGLAWGALGAGLIRIYDTVRDRQLKNP